MLPRGWPGQWQLVVIAGLYVASAACEVGEGKLEYAADPAGGRANAGIPSASGGGGGSPAAGAATGAGRAATASLTCGNGVADPGEGCDNGRFNSDEPGAVCRTSCQLARCGDGIEDAVEECDGGLDCSVDCRRVTCGDGRPDEGEECDPPAAGSCTESCQAVRCGNQRVEAQEECEPPGTLTCSESCTAIQCGNARVDSGEECDPPREGQCTDTCQKIECGNGRVDEGEGCDPPGTGSCDPACRLGGCGNGVVDGAEECDPPASGQCSGECKLIACGNLRRDEGEECDPPTPGMCDAGCKWLACGNGRIDMGEDCDPPEQGTCNPECRTIDCGDGRLDPGELCEPTGANDPSCTPGCAPRGGMGATTLFGFDRDLQNWKFFQAAPAKLAAGTTLTFDSQNGDVSPGALHVQAPFDGFNQKVELQVAFANALDLRGKTLRARVRLESGLSTDAAHPGGIKFFVKSGQDYDYASGVWTNLTPGGGWVEVTFVGDAPILVPGLFSPGEVREIGFELRTFNDSMDHSKVRAASLFIDTITY